MLNNMEFKVKGVTFENEEGKDIQKIIKAEIKELKENNLIYEQYEGYTNTEIKEMDLNVQQYSNVIFNIKIKEDIFEGKPCVKIYIEKNNGDYVHIGYMPKNLIKEYNLIKKEDIEIKGTAELIGGKYKHCIYYENDEYEEIAEVETIELDYGLLVKLNLGHETNNNQEKKEPINVEEYIVKENKNTDTILKQNKKDTSNIIPYIIVGIVSIPFIWIFWKILNFIGWLIDF